MGSKRYTDEYKIEAVRQVTDRGLKVSRTSEYHHAQLLCIAARVQRGAT